MSEVKKDHIISVIESRSLTEMSEAELAKVQAHSNVCSSCKRALEAAQISALLLKEGSPESFEPPPFFHSKVLAALRERQAESQNWAWSRLWKATGALASSMVATVATLAILTLVIPGTQTSTDSLQLSSANSGYSAEEVILNEGESSANQSNIQTPDGQVLTALYDADDDTER